MSDRTADSEVVFRWAEPGDAAVVTAIWQSTARWLEDKGDLLWLPGEFSEPATLAAITDQQLLVGTDSQGVCACALVTDTDEVFWPEQPPGAALYVHKIAVAQRMRGQRLAQRLLLHVETLARTRSISLVRLDCEPRKPLLSLYTACGFTRYDAQPVQRGEFRVQRFEKKLR